MLKHLVNPLFGPVYHLPGVDKMIIQMPPAFAKPTPLAEILNFTFLSYAGTGILVAAIIAGFVMGFGLGSRWSKHYLKTLYVVRYPHLDHHRHAVTGGVDQPASGADGALGLAFARTGLLLSLLRCTMLGWLGVAATGFRTRRPTPCSGAFRW